MDAADYRIDYLSSADGTWYDLVYGTPLGVKSEKSPVVMRLSGIH